MDEYVGTMRGRLYGSMKMMMVGDAGLVVDSCGDIEYSVAKCGDDLRSCVETSRMQAPTTDIDTRDKSLKHL